MFKKITVVVLLAAMLFCYVGCGKIIDEKYVQGSMLPTDDTGSLPTPYDYGDSYGGGDTGGKMSDYSGDGTSYSGPSTPGDCRSSSPWRGLSRMMRM